LRLFVLISLLFAWACTGEKTETGPLDYADTEKQAPQNTDLEAPIWQAGAQLGTQTKVPGEVQLSWPAALDNVGVIRYRVSQDAVEMLQLAATQTTTKVTGLAPTATVTFTVRAQDAAGNLSEALSVDFTVTDPNAPTWPKAANLQASNITDTQVLLGWTPAADLVAVTQYTVYANDIEVATTDGALDTLVSELEPWTEYTFRVEAGDATGNMTQDGPTLTLVTPDLTPPAWTEGDALQSSELTSTSVTVSWPPANDNVGLDGYSVYGEQVLLGYVDASRDSARSSPTSAKYGGWRIATGNLEPAV